MRNRRLPVLVCLFLAVSVAASPRAIGAPEVPAPPSAKVTPGQVLGRGVGKAELVAIGELTKSPAAYVGRTIRVEGVVTDVCPMAGCWIDLAGEAAGTQVHIKVDDGVIVFPKEAKGKQAAVEGVFTRIERTRDEALASAKHLAEERGEAFDPEKADIVLVTYQIKGTGAVIR